MCGIVGLLSDSAVNQDIYDALTVIQHRGQDAAGMMTTDGRRVYLRKANGLVRDVLTADHMLQLQGTMGLGHVRYPTAGTSSPSEAQPLYVNSPVGLCIAHNGNLVNADELRAELQQQEFCHLNTDSDSEVLLNVFASALREELAGGISLNPEVIFNAVRQVMARCQGAYSVVILLVGYGMLAFRDAHGIRPLVWGRRNNAVMVASENVALDALDFKVTADVGAGEAIFIDQTGHSHTAQCAEAPKLSPCLFEYVYLARQDSRLEGLSVYQARLNMGEALAHKIKAQPWAKEIDVVMPVPDTSRTSALALAQIIGVPYREGFVKNRYIGRTFIMPGQKMRKKSIRQKLNAVTEEFEGKRILLVDDSIVRGNTSQQVIQMARDAGASRVFFASMAPEICYPNVYGIDMPAAEELVAHKRDADAINKAIGSDQCVFQDLEALYQAVNDCGAGIERFEDCVFTGDYITGGVDEAYLRKIAAKRKDKSQVQPQLGNDGQVVEMYNNS